MSYYIDNPFKEGQLVLCINDNFPMVETTMVDKSKIGNHPLLHPKVGEICCVDEILGEFLRFDKYDCNDPENPEYGWMWWKHTNFRPLSEKEIFEYYSEDQEEEEVKGGWTVSDVSCPICNYSWIDVRPASLDVLECPKCSQFISLKEEEDNDK